MFTNVHPAITAKIKTDPLRLVWFVKLSLVLMHLDRIESEHSRTDEKQASIKSILTIGQWAGANGPFDAPEPIYKNAFGAWERLANLWYNTSV